MQNHSISKYSQYLNRLALATEEDIDDINPYVFIDDFFSADNISEMKDLLAEACKAALTETYTWKEGSPGNLFYFYESLEKLVEACFIIYVSPKWQKKMSKAKFIQKAKKTLHLVNLPCSLSASEWNQPLLALEAFFTHYPIRSWKKDMSTWLEAGLSNFSVLDSVEAANLYSYQQKLQTLMDACWCIRLRLKK